VKYFLALRARNTSPIHETVMTPFCEMLNEIGLTEQKWRILHTLQESGRLEQTAIAEKVGPASQPSGRTQGYEHQLSAQPFKE